MQPAAAHGLCILCLLVDGALLYGQVLLPTPSGAGAVELGFHSGGAGVAGTGATQLLLAWRFYATLVPIGAGLLLGVTQAAHALAGWLPVSAVRQPQRSTEGDPT